jgi:hypothetical protein
MAIPAICAAEQASRADLAVLHCLYNEAAPGTPVDYSTVLENLIYLYRMTKSQAEQAIADAAMLGLLTDCDAPDP